MNTIHRRSELCALMVLVLATQARSQEPAAKPTVPRPTSEVVKKLVEEDQRPNVANDMRADQAADLCEKVYGKGVNFRHRELAVVLGLVAPVPESSRIPLAEKHLDDRLLKWQRYSFEHRWFSKDWLPNRQQPKPVAYHFRSPEQPLLDSTLYYAWKVRSVEIRVTESSSGALVEIVDPKLDLKRGTPRKDVERLLKDVFGIADEVIADLETDKLTRINLAELLALPEKLKSGDIFGSLKDREALNQLFYLWYTATMGFATDDSICIVVWRRNDLGHLGQKGLSAQWAGGYGHFEDPTWLDTAILEEDGKTRVKPPSLATEGPKKDEP